ncbi:hypothetical protein [Planctomicrobium sp. SH664]|uniref:hypothetical protein n=1 Tax=Planctomicrobium sp. SH664 TaxID=3448125 RepID=UPI003F5B78F8
MTAIKKLWNWNRPFQLAALATLLSGCGTDPYALVPVTGKVLTCEGKPAVGGTIKFLPVDDPTASGRPAGQPGREAYGKVGEDGSFSLTSTGGTEAKGVVTGRHQVLFVMPPTGKRKVMPDMRSSLSEAEIAALEKEYEKDVVPPAIPCSSKVEPVEVTVEAKGAQFEFRLSPP